MPTGERSLIGEVTFRWNLSKKKYQPFNEVTEKFPREMESAKILRQE